ncbi:hypothetical protein BURK2_00663 [Burkholderiales bacterium]|nr:hypothetical protein BURK2_00663 [Burkholderiales bacterium]
MDTSKNSNFVIPAKAGIQMINESPAKRDSIAVWPPVETRRKRLVLSALRGFDSCWIPAFAGMTDILEDI